MLLREKRKTSSGPSSAHLMSAGSSQSVKLVGLPQVGNFLVRVVKQKRTKKKVRRAKDGRIIAPRKAASAGKHQKEQL